MRRLRNGYTNLTRRLPDGTIEKRYQGPDRFDRAQREHDCLLDLNGRMPLPEIVEVNSQAPWLIMRGAPGEHGQDLIDAGHESEVLHLVGRMLRELHDVCPSFVPSLPGQGAVIVHGDFGPQNLLIDVARRKATALLDWEFAHRGSPIEDLAWAEWIVRMHHPGAVHALPALHAGSGLDFAWSARQRAMVARCEELVRFCEFGSSARGLNRWRVRLATTERWTE